MLSPAVELTCGWVRKSAPDRSHPRTSASRRSQPSRSASSRSASRRSARISTEARRVQPRWSPSRPAGQVPAGQVAGVGPPAAYARAGVGQQSADPLVQGVDVEPQERVGVGRRELLDLRARGTRLLVRRAALHLEEVHEHLVQLAHHRQDGRHLRQVVLLAPGDPGVGDLRDLLAGAEALEDRAAGPALLAQGVVDAAAVVVEQVEAGAPAGLVDPEAGRGREGQQHAAQTEAGGTVRSQAGCCHPGIVSCRW